MIALLQQLDGDIAECERQVEFSEAELKKAVKLGAYTEAAMRTELISRHTAMAKRLRGYRDAYLCEMPRETPGCLDGSAEDDLAEAVESLSEFMKTDHYPI